MQLHVYMGVHRHKSCADLIMVFTASKWINSWMKSNNHIKVLGLNITQPTLPGPAAQRVCCPPSSGVGCAKHQTPADHGSQHEYLGQTLPS